MKIIGFITILSLILVLFTSSCTIEKRVHLKGYHVEWKGLNKSNKPKLVKKEKVKHQHEVVEIKDSVGTLIKNTIAQKTVDNQDSILEVVAELMSVNAKENTLQANVNNTPKSRKFLLKFYLSNLSIKLDSNEVDASSVPESVRPPKKGMKIGWKIFWRIFTILVILAIIALIIWAIISWINGIASL